MLALGAGCTGSSDAPAATPAPGATTASAASGAASASAPASAGATAPATGNAQEVCAAAQNAGGQAVTTFITELGAMLTASGKGDTAAAEEAKGKAEAALRSWAAAVKEQSAKATDPRLKQVLAEIGAEVDTMRADIDSVDDAKLDQLQQRLDALCTA
ncbi:hypothetical protein Prum_056540 [Phytohabitans rumicis]|uniref:Uncharacterized protein n=1 Tax=Phytohabitans rumicis TaxID=1076125 RepID=A0A6V8L430_9ACTN|nr:hypothetical protein Prum_056540 [Phytohabitans rumicis]